MRQFWKKIIHTLEGGDPAVLVSIAASGGSTPRGAGAMMAVFPDGSIAGTIGGGNVEYEAQKLGAELLKSGENAVREFRFLPGDAASLGMVCGGDVTLHFQYLPAGDTVVLGVLRHLVELSGQTSGAWLVRRLDGARVVQMRAVSAQERAELPEHLLQPVSVRTGDGWFSVPVERPGRVYLFGGGHVSQALAEVLVRVGFRVAVYDDRAEFSNPERFPTAEQTLCGSFSTLKEQISLTPEDYVVVMTRGHQADYETLAQVLRSGVRYIGCIGSRHKLALCRDRLLKAGFTLEEYAAVHAPIGLEIGAETPEEIAISVAAEMIAVRAGMIS